MKPSPKTSTIQAPVHRKRGLKKIVLVENAEELAQANAFLKTKKRFTQQRDPSGLGLLFEDELIRVYRDPVKLPSGKIGTYLRIEECGMINGIAGSVVLPRLNKSILLQRIYRYPTQSWEWEFPRGSSHVGKSPSQVAREEVKEETNLKLARIRRIGTVKSNTGLLVGKVAVFIADLDDEMASAVPQKDEGISHFKLVTVEELFKMVQSGKIADSFTLAAVLLALSRGALK